MSTLTTHILDTVIGKPASNVLVELYEISDESRFLLSSQITNKDGRTDRPMLANEVFQAGEYELIFNIGGYFLTDDCVRPSAQFLNRIPIRFSIVNTNEKYHVPLLVSPWPYSTYRGS